ncbi:MAG: tRNA pseudouridine synthase A, partial [Candidatus Omnitrophica bacterium]|nr:tRNA pseudouridine synthase A [Candidatus Omnitrophota bacterium]
MRNIKLTISYDGTRYSGWQFQKNGRSIQETIQKALAKVTGESVHLTGSGRTDSGVHAAGQVANFKTRSGLPVKNIQMALNRSLPRDIAIVKAEEEGES